MRGSRNFRQGGPGQSDKKSSDNVLNLFHRSQMVNFKEIYHFSRFQRGSFSRGGGGGEGSNIFRGGGGGGPTFSRGGGGGGGGPIVYSP